MESRVTTKYETAPQALVREFKGESEVALAVCRAESGLRPGAESKTGDHGLCQINLKAHWDKIPGKSREEKIAWLKNFQNNARLARVIKEDSGWYPWVAFKNGNYKVYLNGGR